MATKKTKQVNWRLSEKTRNEIEKAFVKSRGRLTRTQIVEISVLQYALKTAELSEAAKKSLIEFIASQLGHNQESE